MVAALAVALSACSISNQAVVPSATSTHPASMATISLSTTSFRVVPPTYIPVDAAYVAQELADVEVAIRQPDTPVDAYLDLGFRQQRAYHYLVVHPEWLPAVLDAVPLSIRPVVQDNASAGQQIDTLDGGYLETAPTTLPHWRIIPPPAPDVLQGYYQEAQQAYGVPWQYLAAINLIETNMGRIQGLSSAGAQGPMQFMPATWASYGNGDVNNPRDAILAAGRYLRAHGAPTNMNRAVYAYNPSLLYVHAVTLYAKQMFAEPRAYLGYYNWQVYVATADGLVMLPVGFSD